jgi:hypothetical protein
MRRKVSFGNRVARPQKPPGFTFQGEGNNPRVILELRCSLANRKLQIKYALRRTLVHPGIPSFDYIYNNYCIYHYYCYYEE